VAPLTGKTACQTSIGPLMIQNVSVVAGVKFFE
jgi:hypothetical protein